MTNQRYTIEHRTPKKGEQYICYNTQPPIVITVHDDWWQNKADVLVPVTPIADVIQVTESVRTLDGVTILEAPFYATRMDDADGNRYYYAAAYRIDPNIITSWKAIVN